MISLLIAILILALIFGLVWLVLTLIPLPPQFLAIAQVVIAIIFLLVLLGYLLPFAHVPVWSR